MNDDAQDDRMDAAIRDAAASYNVPPATPRDEMWARIQARRVAPAQRQPTARSARLTVTRRVWLSAAAAAVLVMGIGIGYALRGAAPSTNPGQQLAARPTPAAPATPVDTRPSAADTATTIAPPERGRTPQLAAAEPKHRTPSSGARPTAPADAAPDLAFRLAVADHLVRTEALLTSFRTEARTGTVDAQISGWARDLLRTTRLMESSAETQDPTMRRLLGDLDLVLVQIAQYSATAQGSQRGEELDLIEQSIDRRGVLGKLRAAIQPGMIPAGT